VLITEVLVKWGHFAYILMKIMMRILLLWSAGSGNCCYAIVFHACRDSSTSSCCWHRYLPSFLAWFLIARGIYRVLSIGAVDCAIGCDDGLVFPCSLSIAWQWLEALMTLFISTRLCLSMISNDPGNLEVLRWFEFLHYVLKLRPLN